MLLITVYFICDLLWSFLYVPIMSLFLLTCPALVDTFRIGTHTLFFPIPIYISFLTVFHLTVARLLLSLIGLESSFYLVFPAIASGLSIYTHGVPVLTYLTSGLSIYTHSVPVLTYLTSGLSIYTHGVPVLTYPASGLSIYTHSTPVLTTLTPFVSYSLVARTPILPLHFFFFKLF